MINNSVSMKNADNLTDEDVMNAYRDIFPKCDWDENGATTDDERMICIDNIIFYMADHQNTPSLLDFKAGDRETTGFFEVLFSSGADSLPTGEVVVNLDYKYIFIQN